MQSNQSEATDYSIECSRGVVVDDDARGLRQLKGINGDLLEDDGAEARLVLSPKLKFVENIIKLTNKSFDFPCNTDLQSLVLRCFNTMDESQLL